MERTVERIQFPTIYKPKLTKVAAYARVSSGKDAMLHSLAAQVGYYSELIHKNPEWEYGGVYSDEAITGTKEGRKGFQEMLEACRNGKIDLVITKSISRFARNTVTLLKSVRELKQLGVDVFFEEQNIHSMSSDGELMLTILASYAQEESRSVSENMKWRVRKNFEEGMPWNGTVLGYRYKNGKYVVVSYEAEIVKRIFADYLDGQGVVMIADKLTEEGIPTRFGNPWCKSTVTKILRNYSYTGNLILQKTFRENHITKKTLINEGQLPKYHAVETHEPIISLETFNAVQAEMERRAKKFNCGSKPKQTYPFTGLIVCEKCGKHFRRKTTATGIVWICATFNTHGKKACASKQIPEATLEGIAEDIDLEDITEITAGDGNLLTFHFKDGSSETRQWKDRSRSESWTDEMKAEARRKKLMRIGEQK